MELSTPTLHRVLLVEDNPGDAYLFQYFFRTLSPCTQVYTTADARSALDLLHCTGAYAEAQRLDLIVLDIGLPDRTGWELLAIFKNDTALDSIPVIALSGFFLGSDLQPKGPPTFDLYLKKPTNTLAEYPDLIRTILQYWTSERRIVDRN